MLRTSYALTAWLNVYHLINQHKIHASIFLIIQRQDIQKIFQRVKHVHDIAQHLLSLNEDGKSLKVTTLFRSHQKCLIYGRSWRYLSTWPSSQHPKQSLVNCLDLGFIFLKHTPKGRDSGLSSPTSVRGSFPQKYLFLLGHPFFYYLPCCSTQLLRQGLLQVRLPPRNHSGPLSPSSPAHLWIHLGPDFIWTAALVVSFISYLTKAKWSLRQNGPSIDP